MEKISSLAFIGPLALFFAKKCYSVKVKEEETIMMRYLATFTAFLAILAIAFFIAPQAVMAQSNTCSYQSTQARVQPNVQTPLTQHLTVKCGESFLVSSFHDDSGQWATDTVIDVSGPKGFFLGSLGNGAKVHTLENATGIYYVNVRTVGQSGSSCSAQAYVSTWCPVPTPQPVACEYDSVQARVKLPGQQPWERELVVKRGDIFEVGGFYDHSGQYIPADKVKITIIDPKGHKTTNLKNGDGYKTRVVGTHRVRVEVQGQTGRECREVARVRVTRSWAR